MDKKVTGNTDGISNAKLEQLNEIYNIEIPRNCFATQELLQAMATHSAELNREVSVMLTRGGRVENVSVGHFDRVSMPELNMKRSTDRLSGIRCIHTHPKGDGMLSDVDLGTLKEMRLDAMASFAIRQGQPADMYVSYLTGEDEPPVLILGPVKPGQVTASELMEELREADSKVGRFEAYVSEARKERAILIGLTDDGMDELAELAKTAGAEVVAMEVQARNKPDTGLYLGHGKVEDLVLLRANLNADMIIINGDITPTQQRNLESRINAKIVDRTMLILDIFSLRAKSREGRLQVELAQLKYMMNRLTGQGVALSRQGAGSGIAARGPGETKLETDRRRIRKRITDLERQLKEVSSQRQMRREKRSKANVPVIALVGYTNAGKSSLLNALSGADAFSEDILFATLDPMVRSVDIEGREALLTDTVGFVQNLPHDLIEAFHSTLEEVVYADILLYVLDGSNPEMNMHIKVIDDVIARLGAEGKPKLVAYNKRDIAGPAPEGMIEISAKTGHGLADLKQALYETMSQRWKLASLRIPYSRSDLAASIRAKGRVLNEDYRQDDIVFDVELPLAEMQRIREALID